MAATVTILSTFSVQVGDKKKKKLHHETRQPERPVGKTRKKIRKIRLPTKLLIKQSKQQKKRKKNLLTFCFYLWQQQTANNKQQQQKKIFI